MPDEIAMPFSNYVRIYCLGLIKGNNMPVKYVYVSNTRFIPIIFSLSSSFAFTAFVRQKYFGVTRHVFKTF